MAPLRSDHGPFLQQKHEQHVKQVLVHHLAPHVRPESLLLCRVSDKCEYAQAELVSPLPLTLLYNIQRDMRLSVFKISLLLSVRPTAVRFYYSASQSPPPFIFRKPRSSSPVTGGKRKRKCMTYCSCACCIDPVKQRVSKNFPPLPAMSYEKRQRLVGLLAEAELLQGASTPLYAGGVYSHKDNVVHLERFDSLEVREIENLLTKAQGIVREVIILPTGGVQLRLSD